MNIELSTHQAPSKQNLKLLSNEDLNAQLQILVRQEREILSDILYHIAEVDRRRLYLEMAYPNLFAYLTEHLGYSNGSAQRRIDAARLLREVPTLTEKLESGNINLMQVSIMQKAIRQKKKESKESSSRQSKSETQAPVGTHDLVKSPDSLSAQEKKDLLEKLSGQSFEATQKIVAQTLDLEIKQAPQVRHQKDNSVRFEVTFTEQQWQKLQHMRELLSNSLPHGSWDQVLEYLADKVITQKTKPAKPRNNPSAKTQALPHPSDRPVPASIKKQVQHRDLCCQYTNPVSGKKCAAKWNLHVDHIQPRWAGGSNDPQNLRVLCQQHNQHIYKQQAGLRDLS